MEVIDIWGNRKLFCSVFWFCLFGGGGVNIELGK